MEPLQNARFRALVPAAGPWPGNTNSGGHWSVISLDVKVLNARVRQLGLWAAPGDRPVEPERRTFSRGLPRL